MPITTKTVTFKEQVPGEGKILMKVENDEVLYAKHIVLPKDAEPWKEVELTDEVIEKMEQGKE